MNEPDLGHLKGLRTSLLGILEESTGHLQYLDKVDARSWKLHVVDPLYVVAKFVGNRVIESQTR
jgi:hypothetical protein